MAKKYKYSKSFTFEGKRYYVRADTKEELAAKMAMKRRDLAEGVKSITKQMTFTAWAEEWLKTYKAPSVSPETLRIYRGVINKHILPYLGSMRMSQIRPAHVQSMINNVSGYSEKIIERVSQLTWSMFDAAEANGLVIENPAARTKKPKGKKQQSRRSITDRERELSLELAKTHRMGMLILLMLYCGLRPQEAIALQWRHIDFKENILTVDQAAKMITGTGAPKSDAGYRQIPMPKQLVGALHHHRETYGYSSGPFDFVLRNTQGNRITANSVRKMWASWKNELNILAGCRNVKGKAVPPYRIADDLVPYMYRHTYCTDLQDAGIPINVARELMGHADISTTSKIYTHHSPRSFEDAREKLAKLYEIL